MDGRVDDEVVLVKKSRAVTKNVVQSTHSKEAGMQ